MSHTLDSISLTFPTLGTLDGSNPIVVIGPNGVGKSRLMRTLVPAERFVSAQRRTFLEDRIPSYSREQSQQEMRNNFANSYSQPWQLSSEIDAVFARVLGEHYPDVRFVYVTHELNFALSRKDPYLVVVRDEGTVERASIEELPGWLAEALLGAATLTSSDDRRRS